MSWLVLTLSCIILWGITDILYKVSMDRNDPLSHYKSFIWIGIVMALAGIIMSYWSDTLFNSLKVVISDLPFLFPLCIFYVAATFFGLFGIKHLDASIVSVLENIDGAMAALIIYFYYLYTGNINPSDTFNVLDFIATISVIVGIILLGHQEQALFKQEINLDNDKKKHRFGALALFFPIIYNLADVLSASEVGGSVGGETAVVIPGIDFFIFECAGFAIAAILVWLYLCFVKKYKYNPFNEGEIIRSGAATAETFGTMTFILAAESKPVLTGPITSLYCIVTIVLARIFLKERLTKKQYISLGFLVFGIVLLGIAEIFTK